MDAATREHIAAFQLGLCSSSGFNHESDSSIYAIQPSRRHGERKRRIVYTTSARMKQGSGMKKASEISGGMYCVLRWVSIR